MSHLIRKRKINWPCLSQAPDKFTATRHFSSTFMEQLEWDIMLGVIGREASSSLQPHLLVIPAQRKPFDICSGDIVTA
jgi:hypothetical protein